MEAEHLLRDGRVQEALENVQSQIRSLPDKSEYRVFLFQLLAILGQWERSLTQLNIVADLDEAAWPMVYLHREALHCEVFREEVFSGCSKPLVFGKPSQWIALLLESLRLACDGHYDQASTLREQALEQAPESGGTINGEPFTWIADADTRLGPVLEIILNGRYYWAPISQISAISTTEPEDLRDLVWLPAEITWINGGQAYGLIPVRYPGSETSQDPAIQLARKTEWEEVADNTFYGRGQRMLVTDQNEYPLLEVRNIEFGCK